MAIAHKRRMKEPGSLEDFELKTGFGREAVLEKLAIRDIKGRRPSFEPVKAVECLEKELLRGSDGSGMHFFFPLTQMEALGEFFKGVLRVVAPKARVTLLVTPDRLYENRNGEENLRAHIGRAIRPNDKKFVVVDTMRHGITYDRVKTQLLALTNATEKDITFLPETFFGLWYSGTGSVTRKKTESGSFAIGSGYLLNYFLRHTEVNIAANEYTYLADHLLTRFRNNPKRFFSQEEFDMFKEKEYNEPPNSRESWIELSPLIHFVRTLPPERQRQIINRLNREDAATARAFYYYGMAAAKDYLKKQEAK